MAADVCRVLGIVHAYKAVAPLPADEKNHHQMMGGGKLAAIISEPGLYRLIMRSDKPVARPFQD
ncbi:BRO-N domain-containing protein [Blastochloris tepida]|uniref:BRO-N domain-containing protein n=1 Tax=Blastochloris tepida TaxID=2233851 RepID=UPI001357D9B2|nr:Bro-N domain-containing protein [Blastochloris tepida]